MPLRKVADCMSVVLALLAAACGGDAPVLDVCRPAIRDIEVAVTTNGRIEAGDAAALHAHASGPVERVAAELGMVVERGQEVVRIGDAGQSAGHARAAARLSAAEARLARLEAGLAPSEAAALRARHATLSRALNAAVDETGGLRRLLALDAVSRLELEAQERTVADLTEEISALDVRLASAPPPGQRAELEAEVAEAGAALEEARRAATDLSVRAPVAGQVYSLQVAVGDFVEAGQLVGHVGTIGRVRARVYVDEPDLGAVTAGARTVLTADPYPGKEWPCRIDSIPAQIVQAGLRRVGEALCAVDNPDGTLLPGLAVRARIVVQTAQRALSLPRESISREGPVTYAWILEGGFLRRRPVRLGAAGPAHVEILEGVDSASMVVLPGDAPLRAGERASARLLDE